MSEEEQRRRRANIMLAAALGLIAVAVFVGFIWSTGTATG